MGKLISLSPFHGAMVLVSDVVSTCRSLRRRGHKITHCLFKLDEARQSYLDAVLATYPEYVFVWIAQICNVSVDDARAMVKREFLYEDEKN